MDAQQVANIQNAVLQKIQQNSSQACGLLKFLHLKTTPAIGNSNEFAVFIITAIVQAHIHGETAVLKLLVSLGHSLDFPVTIKSASTRPDGKMAPLEMLCYTQPHKLQQPKFQDLARFSFQASRFAGYPPQNKANLGFVLQEIDDAAQHLSFFSSSSQTGNTSSDPFNVRPEFDLNLNGDPKTHRAIVHFESESIGVEPNYFAQLIAVREKWWARLDKQPTKPVDDAPEISPQQTNGQSQGLDIAHLLSRWNEKIAMKQLFQDAGIANELIVPTLYSAYFDELLASTAAVPDADETNTIIQAKISQAVAEAFSKNKALNIVHVKPSHMCRGLGITKISRAQYEQGRELSGEGDLLLDLNADLFRRKLSKELAPLALSHSRRGVIIEPHISHSSEIRITCVFGRPVAAVSYRPDDSDGVHDIMFDHNKTRESSTRRVKAYLTKMDATLSDGAGVSTSTWDKICAVASSVAKGTDFLRVDFFLDAQTGQFWLNEMDPTYAYITALGFHGYLACDFIGQMWFSVWKQKIVAQKRAAIEKRLAALKKNGDDATDR